uniref:Blocked early in transport 1 n=1 Tax=Kwoniella dejecticola CBS 10117 TaxID=1296121 RepID=A0A1A6A9Y8_9TREE|nr:blocked early in transport 1 [Kwoniella dejecticola CBS 10117]OBR86868.1 blocked early in transport 1 [Kwoniella dejecticola CBS 10117]
MTSRLTTLSQRNPTTHSNTPSPILYPPSGPSSGRVSPFPRPGSTASQYSESPYGGGMNSGTGPGSGLGGLGASPNMGMGVGGQGSGYTRSTHEVEGQNDERLEGLLGKVKILKDITVGIGSEVRDSNVLLGNMNDSFSSTSTFLGGTFRRMNKMAKRQGGNWCWFMGFLLIVLWIFIILWWFRR